MEIIEIKNDEHITELAKMFTELWPECNYAEEVGNCEKIANSDRDVAFLSVNNQGAFTGFVYMSLRTDYVEGTTTTPVGYIEGIYVKEEFRRQGTARNLIKRAELWCRERGCRELASDTETHNESSQSFHRKMGFEEMNRIVCYKKSI